MCIVENTYEKARTYYKACVVVTGLITCRGAASSTLTIIPVRHAIGCAGQDHHRTNPWCMLFADDISMWCTGRGEVDRMLDEWVEQWEREE